MSLVRLSESDYGDKYKDHYLEQYKLYVEMADRISSRRMLANSFFVTIHSLLITAFTLMLKEKIFSNDFFSLLPFICAIMLCLMWVIIIDSYKQLNSGKFKVIHEFESSLPASPYDEEWIVLDKGENKKKYFPLTHVEALIPLIFVFIYFSLAVGLFL